MASRQKLDWLKFVTLLSGVSLVVFGGLSALIGVVYWSFAGLAIGLGLLAHGSIELRKRSQLFSERSSGAVRWLFWNQIALAVTVSLYFVWQIGAVDPTAVLNALKGPDLALIWEMYPEDVRRMVESSLPSILRLTYSVLLVVVWFGCLFTAFFYRKRGRAYLISVRELG